MATTYAVRGTLLEYDPTNNKIWVDRASKRDDGTWQINWDVQNDGANAQQFASRRVADEIASVIDPDVEHCSAIEVIVFEDGKPIEPLMPDVLG